jgi:hypothetical protein
MAKKPVNIEVIEENGERFLLTTYNDGTLVRCRVDPNQKPKRKPRLNSSATEQQHPWLWVLLIVTSLFGVGSLALLNGTDVNPDSVSYLLELLVGTAANAYLSHSFYQQLRRQ